MPSSAFGTNGPSMNAEAPHIVQRSDGRLVALARQFSLNRSGNGTFPATVQPTVTFALTCGGRVLALGCAALLATFVLLIGVGVNAR